MGRVWDGWSERERGRGECREMCKERECERRWDEWWGKVYIRSMATAYSVIIIVRICNINAPLFESYERI